MSVAVSTVHGETLEVSAQSLEVLTSSVRGSVVTPGSPGYDEARTIWNGMIDRRPGLVVRCAGQADVVRAVRFATERELLIAVRGAGHNIAGKGVADGSLLIDLSGLRSVRVDPKAKRVFVEPGATLRDLDDETQVFGLATPTGINSTTGIAGLTLGGGFGWLSKKYGLTVDSLRSAQVVLADGRVVNASAHEHPDLFGGSGEAVATLESSPRSNSNSTKSAPPCCPG